jgi:branched-chain amino acid transport system substrate-binding protein
MTTRRRFVLQAGALVGASALGALVPTIARAQAAKLRVGLMLPYTGTFAALGTAITQGFNLAIEENGGKLGGRDIEFFTVDDESEPAKATDNANKLVQRDKVDVLLGNVHSGVVMAMVKVARHGRCRYSNAGANAATGSQCPISSARRFPTGSRAYRWARWYDKGHRKVTLTWKWRRRGVSGELQRRSPLGGWSSGSLPFRTSSSSFLTDIASLADAGSCSSPAVALRSSPRTIWPPD